MNVVTAGILVNVLRVGKASLTDARGELFDAARPSG